MRMVRVPGTLGGREITYERCGGDGLISRALELASPMPYTNYYSGRSPDHCPSRRVPGWEIAITAAGGSVYQIFTSSTSDVPPTANWERAIDGCGAPCRPCYIQTDSWSTGCSYCGSSSSFSSDYVYNQFTSPSDDVRIILVPAGGR